jgi:hypothetical protein
MTLDEFFANFLKRSKREWREAFASGLERVRVWISESSEVAFLASFLLGVTVALCFKFFLLMGVIVALIGGIVYYLAPSGE